MPRTRIVKYVLPHGREAFGVEMFHAQINTYVPIEIFPTLDSAMGCATELAACSGEVVWSSEAIAS